ncbi:MAG: DUF721 domain-containing protein [Candidatus Omnitrophica bacterium]|nr:DUF721 domain-containing protein [Candidatus Omnitrophota bacterium]MCM8768526.1 DUF721 domain-containing protein [Candidatus Omnitrophota bacterium]
MEIERIDSILQRLLNIPQVDSETLERTLEPDVLWGRTVNKYLAAHSYVDQVKGDTLIVKVDSSVYLQELRMSQKQLEESIRKKSQGQYTRLRFIL